MDNKNNTSYLSSDHGGFELKNFLANELKARGYSIDDLGPDTYKPDDDYTDYAAETAKAVSANPQSAGIVICKNGVGVSVVANRYKGVRCALSWSPEHIKSARNDDDVNVLALPANFIDKETGLKVVIAFLETPASNEERHVRRRKKLEDLGV